VILIIAGYKQALLAAVSGSSFPLLRLPFPSKFQHLNQPIASVAVSWQPGEERMATIPDVVLETWAKQANAVNFVAGELSLGLARF